jgi:recombination protein RecR
MFTPPRSQDPVSKLIFEFSKLPGVGEKTATRLAYFVLKQEINYAQTLASALLNAKEKVGLCSLCFTFTDQVPCRICVDPTRDGGIICVVERPSDVHSIELSGKHKGLYHVLHGALSPLDGIGPEEIRVQELVERVRQGIGGVREIILATNPSVEGEATALYLTRVLKPSLLRLTQLAHGLPMGGAIEYADRQTLGKAFENRVEMS